MMKKVTLERKDECLPQEIESEAQHFFDLLIDHEIYTVPFVRMLLNMPGNLIDNPRYTAELQEYFLNGFELNRYYLGDEYDLGLVKRMVDALISFFAFYDDGGFLAFIQRNSQYSTPRREQPESLQKTAYDRLRGFLFEFVVGKLFGQKYQKTGTVYQCGCCILIEGIVIQTKHRGIPRSTVDIAGLDAEMQSGDLLECKIQPMRITDYIVKFMDRLLQEIKAAGYVDVRVGFVTAGTATMARMQLAKCLNELGMTDPGFCVYEIGDLLELALGA